MESSAWRWYCTTSWGLDIERCVYHNGMAIKLQTAGLSFESEPYIAVTLEDGSEVKGQSPDLAVERLVTVELKAHVYTLSRDQ